MRAIPCHNSRQTIKFHAHKRPRPQAEGVEAPGTQARRSEQTHLRSRPPSYNKITTVTFRPLRPQSKQQNKLPLCRSPENRASAAAVLLRNLLQMPTLWRPSRFVSADVRETRLHEALLDFVTGESTNQAVRTTFFVIVLF